MGAELDERTIAAEADLLDRAVSFTKGCYTGQELVARLDARGNRVARHLRGLVVAGSARGAPARVSVRIRRSRGPRSSSRARWSGTVTSSAWSPALGVPGGAGLRAPHRALRRAPVELPRRRRRTRGGGGRRLVLRCRGAQRFPWSERAY